MAGLQILCRGLSSLLAGDVRTPFEEIFLDRDNEETVREVSGHVSEPDWIRPGLADRFLNVSSPHVDEYYASVRTDSERTVRISPDDPFDRVEFEVLDVEHTREVTVTLEYTTTSEERHERVATFVNGSFGRDGKLPVAFDLQDAATSAEISLSVETAPSPVSTRIVRSLPRGARTVTTTPKLTVEPEISLPSFRSTSPSGPPIFYISIDTFRHDYLSTFEPVIDALGDDVVAPSDPRTQGIATQESHGATFTGTHPGTHGIGQRGDLDPSLTTIPELLAECGYKCTGSVSTWNLSPQLGFGRGFHKFIHEEMSWEDRHFDAKTSVNTLVDELENDASQRGGGMFYFLHLFDAHYPYIPPARLDGHDTLDLAAMDTLLDEGQKTTDYLELLHGDPLSIPDSVLDQAESYYEESLRHVAEQVRRFIEAIDDVGLLDDSFVVVAGDHGEDFLERNFVFHNSLYDTNIRPGMIVKPPKNASFDVPNDPDLVDLLPTIAHLVDADIPDQCVGTAWQRNRQTRERITERLGDNWYNISVEIDGLKGIFTYPGGEGRPSIDQVSAGPVECEFYELKTLDENIPRESTASEGEQLQEEAERFLRNQHEASPSGDVERGISNDVEERLEQLGYK